MAFDIDFGVCMIDFMLCSQLSMVARVVVVEHQLKYKMTPDTNSILRLKNQKPVNQNVKCRFFFTFSLIQIQIDHFIIIFLHCRKSYGYQVQEPAAEPKVDDTKYKFDYTLQAPVEEKQEETPQRTLYTKIDRMTEDKPGE